MNLGLVHAEANQFVRSMGERFDVVILNELLDDIHAEDLADIISELEPDEAAALLARIPAEDAAPIFERLEEHGDVEGLEPDASLVADPRWRSRIRGETLGAGFRGTGDYDLVLKPFRPEGLLRAVRGALERKRNGHQKC